MKHFFYLLALTVIVASCTQPFKKAKDGTQYKIIKSSGGKKIATGNYMEYSVVAKYKDSVLMSTFEDGLPQYAPYDTAQFPPLFREIFKELHVGDSIVIKLSTDSLINSGRAQPFMKKGQFITQSFKFLNVYPTKEQSDSAFKVHLPVAKARAYQKTTAQIQKDLNTTSAAQMKIDDQILTDFITKRGIKASKTDWGTYVAVTAPGTGENLNEKNIALVNYTGRTLVDTVFDSNTDPKFGHLEPLSVDMSQYTVMPGWLDGLKKLKKGSKATLLIPSPLAYGKGGRGGAIKPNENLLFDIEVVDIITPEQNEAMQMARQQQMAAKQQEQQMAMRKMQEEAMKKSSKDSSGRK